MGIIMTLALPLFVLAFGLGTAAFEQSRLQASAANYAGSNGLLSLGRIKAYKLCYEHFVIQLGRPPDICPREDLTQELFPTGYLCLSEPPVSIEYATVPPVWPPYAGQDPSTLEISVTLTCPAVGAGNVRTTVNLSLPIQTN